MLLKTFTHFYLNMKEQYHMKLRMNRGFIKNNIAVCTFFCSLVDLMLCFSGDDVDRVLTGRRD